VLSSLLTLQSGQVGRDLPQYMDFHLGRANSLRGHTVDDLGYDLFGKQQLLTTVEYRVPLVDPTEITLFGISADLGWEASSSTAVWPGRLGRTSISNGRASAWAVGCGGCFPRWI
jgi:outer membrane protein assembly factor BamA